MSFRRITKLNVNIVKCQTFITYANATTRFMINNPSGFVFRGPIPADSHCCTDTASKTIEFLERHFGRDGSISKTSSLRDMLHAVGLDSYADTVSDYLEQQQQAEEQRQLEAAEAERLKTMQLHTWHLETLPKVRPKRATKIDRPTAEMKVLTLTWHLQNCKWRYFDGFEFQLPKCHCLKIKETMDYINELANSTPPTPENLEKAEEPTQAQAQTAFDNELIPDMNANIVCLNSLIQELNELLELQNQEQLNSDL